MRNKFIFSIVILLAAVHFTICRSPVSAAETRIDLTEERSDPTEKKIALSLHAGQHDRSDVFVSVLIDAEKARSVFVEYADGTLGRARLVDPGMLNASWRGKGKKELHFVVPKMAKRETLKVVAALSESPAEGRTYVWSGEPRQNRRVSCGQCHQGLSIPTGEELRQRAEDDGGDGKTPGAGLA